MPRQLLLLFALAGLLTACSPSLNWREVKSDTGGLNLLLPCKPDRGSRVVPLGGQPTTLQMVGCDAAGATFALAHATLAPEAPGVAPLADVLTGWRAATVANIQGRETAPLAAAVPGADRGEGVAPVRVRAAGRRPDGSAVESEALYFSHGRQVFQAVVYATKLTPEMSDTFFQSLKFP